MFSDLNDLLIKNIDKLQKGGLYKVDVDRDKIFQLYLDGFDEEYRQEHNCNCCKSFIRQYGGIVSIIDNKVVSIWDNINAPDKYAKSLENLSQYIHSLAISSVFYNNSTECGTKQSFDKKRGLVWKHFYFSLNSRFITNDIGEKSNLDNTSKEVLVRSLQEISLESVDVVLELIAQNSLYRGNEFKNTITEFRKLKKQYDSLKTEEKDLFCWSKVKDVHASVLRIKNSSIGTLLLDLTSGTELDIAVTKFERVVAPTNYKRPTALITNKMIDATKKKLEELGLINSLNRRYANLTDINVENLLFTDKSSELNDVFDMVAKDAIVDVRKMSKVEEISIDDFINNVLPSTKSVELLLENRQFNNFVSLITAEEECKLFKWDNPFSWSYTGGITDSIKERVKQAGGKVDGVLRASLSWSNYDDLDLHCIEPDGTEIYFGRKRSNSGGTLDVDMNAGGGTTRTPVENIIWTNEHTMREGLYKVRVHNYNKRDSTDQGYDIEIECNGEIFNFSDHNNPRSQSYGLEVSFTWSRKDGIRFNDKNLVSKTNSKEKWGVKSNTFVKVKQCMLSPNYWQQSVGNKHYFFILDNCVSDEKPRPFFNEFLRNDLDSHKKVLEVLGGKIKIEDTPNQLSGLGFSETQRNNFTVRVKGAFTRILKVNI